MYPNRPVYKRFKHVLRCEKHIYKDIHDAEEGEFRGNEVGALVIRDLDHLNRAFTALSSDCPDTVKDSEVQTYNDPSEDPLSCMPTIVNLFVMDCYVRFVRIQPITLC